MASIEKSDNFHQIESGPSLQDVFAEIAGLTEYQSNGVNYVNLSFLANRVTSFADDQGRPALSRVGLVKVGSITMTRERAVALRDMLVNGLSHKVAEKG